jgi:hypothetical protein
MIDENGHAGRFSHSSPRPARTPKGTEVRTVVKHVTRRLRRHWPHTRIVCGADSHYGRVEAMEWAEDNGADYIFGLAGNATLDALVAETADNLRFHHAKSSATKLRTYASFATSIRVNRSNTKTTKREAGRLPKKPSLRRASRREYKNSACDLPGRADRIRTGLCRSRSYLGHQHPGQSSSLHKTC